MIFYFDICNFYILNKDKKQSSHSFGYTQKFAAAVATSY